MIIYDICSFPSGLNFDVWYDLFLKKIIFYDSTMGKEPVSIDGDDVSLIDMNSMKEEELEKVAEIIKELNEEYLEKQLEQSDVIRNNNSKLIKYFQKINNNEDPFDILR